MTIVTCTERRSPVRGGRHRSTRPRTLHLLDVENLVPDGINTQAVTDMWTEFVQVMQPRWDDQSTVAVARRHAATAFLALPVGLRRVVGSDGPNGADEALLDSADIDWAAAHFGRVVIGSGDHIFAPLADGLRARGVWVVQVIGAGACSAVLYRACGEHKYLKNTRDSAARRYPPTTAAGKSPERPTPIPIEQLYDQLIPGEPAPPTTKAVPMSPRTPIRHGEILLLPVASAPEGTVETVTECIVGHSETGHHHVLESDTVFAQIVAANGDLYVDLDAPTPLRHRKQFQQHRELSVPAGAWRVIRKSEFDTRSFVAPRPVVAPEDLPPRKRPRARQAPATPRASSYRWVRD
jgi:hypothetical protein